MKQRLCHGRNKMLIVPRSLEFASIMKNLVMRLLPTVRVQDQSTELAAYQVMLLFEFKHILCTPKSEVAN